MPTWQIGKPDLRGTYWKSADEPFCTVLLEEVSEPIGVSRGRLVRRTRRAGLPSWGTSIRTTNVVVYCCVSWLLAPVGNPLRSRKMHSTETGPISRREGTSHPVRNWLLASAVLFLGILVAGFVLAIQNWPFTRAHPLYRFSSGPNP
jgi:hypothetical protein